MSLKWIAQQLGAGSWKYLPNKLSVVPEPEPNQLTGRAFEALKIFKGRARALEALAEYLLKREK